MKTAPPKPVVSAARSGVPPPPRWSEEGEWWTQRRASAGVPSAAVEMVWAGMACPPHVRLLPSGILCEVPCGGDAEAETAAMRAAAGPFPTDGEAVPAFDAAWAPGWPSVPRPAGGQAVRLDTARGPEVAEITARPGCFRLRCEGGVMPSPDVESLAVAMLALCGRVRLVRPFIDQTGAWGLEAMVHPAFLPDALGALSLAAELGLPELRFRFGADDVADDSAGG